MKTRLICIAGMVVLFVLGCKNEQRVDINRTLKMSISLESKQLHKGVPNFLTLKIKNTSERTVKVPDSDLIIEFTSYSGSIRRVISLNDILNSSSGLGSISNLSLTPGEDKIVRIELGDIVYASLHHDEHILPADDYTINVFLSGGKEMQGMQYASNIRSNYLDIYIPD